MCFNCRGKLQEMWKRPQGKKKKRMCRKPTSPLGPTACWAIVHMLYVATLGGTIFLVLPTRLLSPATHYLPSTPTYRVEPGDGAYQAELCHFRSWLWASKPVATPWAGEEVGGKKLFLHVSLHDTPVRKHMGKYKTSSFSEYLLQPKFQPVA